MKMKKYVSLSLSLMLLLVTAFAAGPASAKSPTILEFNTMVGVPRPYTGSTNAIRGVPGGGLPWVISFGKGELKADGKLEVKVMGLVLDPTDPQVMAGGRGGTNPSATFKVTVSCLSRDTGVTPPVPTTVNVSTDPFPADAAGNAQVEAQLSLPSPCIAPIIFVTSGTGSWFAATGF